VVLYLRLLNEDVGYNPYREALINKESLISGDINHGHLNQYTFNYH